MNYTRLRYHFVFSTKFRAPWLTEEVWESLPVLFASQLERCGARLVMCNGVEDHAHVIAAVPASVPLSIAMKHLKGGSSRHLKEEEVVKDHFAWGRGFGAFSLDPVRMEGIRDYVARQREHHARGTIWDQYERIRVRSQAREDRHFL